jgi:hypothetical protein
MARDAFHTKLEEIIEFTRFSRISRNINTQTCIIYIIICYFDTHTRTHTIMGISLDFREICLRELAVAARRSRSRALAAKIHSGMVTEAHMDHDSAGSIEQLAFCACNNRVLATFAVQALSTPAWATGGMHGWRVTKGVEAGRLARRLLPVAVQRLPVVADTGEHRAAGRVLNEGPYGHCIP